MIVVDLTGDEMYRASIAALTRIANAQDRNYQSRRPMPSLEAKRYDLHGCMAELAVSIALNLPWTDENGTFGHDVGDLEVRSRSSAAAWFRLRSYELDKYDARQRFVFATVDNANKVTINGWSQIGYLAKHWRPAAVQGDNYQSYIFDDSALYDILTVNL